MVKRKVTGVVKAPKSDVQTIHDIAIRKHIKHPDLIKEIERLTLEFQKRELNGEILDRPAALQQFRMDIERVGAHIPIPPKDPGLKTGPIVKKWVKSSPKETSWARKKPVKGKRQSQKRTFVK